MVGENPKEGGKTESNAHINLKVVGPDGSVVQFKLNLWTPLDKLMKAYCERQGLTMRQIRFRFDGQPFNEMDTPAQLQMEDEDEINVFHAFPYPMMALTNQNTEHINIKVVGPDKSVVQFKIKRHTPLSKLMKAYCEKQGLTMRQIRFRFDGQPFNETDTPAQLQMEDEEVIDVFHAIPYPSLINQNSEHINLKVVGPEDESVVQFKIKRHTPLSKLMKAYCERQGLTMRQIRFRFEGQSFNETDTPAQLQMEDEEVIDVFRAFPYPMMALTNQNSEHINLKVVGPEDESVVQFKIKRHTPLSKLMKAYCERQGLTMRHIRFRYGGEAFNDTDTPGQLQMKDEDEIDVFRAFPYPMIIPCQRQGNLSE